MALSAAKRVVVKVGSALVAEAGQPRTDWLSALAKDVAEMRARGQDVVLVSSGAISLGRGLVSDAPLKALEEKQAAAALGQPLLMAALSEAFSPHGIRTAQALLTLEDTERRRRWLNARATLETLLEAGALPVINENDTVATDEIRYGDNDRLAARVAQMIGADVLVLLSDVDGLYTADPRKDTHAEHIARLDAIGSEHDAMAGEAHVGSGGMATKIQAARIAFTSGCATVITLGNRRAPLVSIDQGERATWIVPPHTSEAARALWLKGHLKPEGTVEIDAGAAAALRKGASLLPVGVQRIKGQFERGAAVAVSDPTGGLIAKGIVAYDAADLHQIAGLHTDEVEAILGHRGRPAVIHRNDLILEL
ncbi:MAG: glutamate 5-kinase [Pseudomonadota bacterium]